jgi:hypothetical protein
MKGDLLFEIFIKNLTIEQNNLPKIQNILNKKSPLIKEEA